MALWHLNCAINLNPKFLEAIEMKEKITGKVVTDVDNSAIRSFVRRQIMAEMPAPSTAAAPATRPSVADTKTKPMQTPATKPSFARDSGVLAKPVTAVPIEPDDDQTTNGN
jgi:hypothetical protein